MAHEETITLTLTVPDGWELTGEYRPAQPGEHYLEFHFGVCSVARWPSLTGTCNSYLILRSPKPPEKRKGWLNVYPYGSPYFDVIFPSKSLADCGKHSNDRIACVEIDYQVPSH